jgi:hypothetical protein
VGSISSTGLYQAPEIPPPVPVVVAAQSGSFPRISGSATVEVVNPVPRLASVSPSITIAKAEPVAVVLRGDNFTPQSRVLAGSTACSITFVSSNELHAIISPEILQGAPTLAISVDTPAPGGGRSIAQTIPVIASGAVGATPHPLVAQYQISVPQDGQVSIEFGTDISYKWHTWKRPLPAGGGTLTLLVGGMRASTTYHMRARIELDSGISLLDSDHVFTTGPLVNVTFPQPVVTRTPGFSDGGGVELVSTGTRVSALAFDTDGHVIWYYYDPDLNSPASPIRELDNGNYLINFSIKVREVDLEGQTVREITLNQLNAALKAAGYSLQASVFHHDAIRLPNGHWILLVNERRDFEDLPGYPGTTTVTGDALVDVDTNNQPVWVWRAFDHLDVNRHPIWFPDWTHSNTVVYTPDGNLLVSMRHQSWIIEIDYANGTGTGDILWRLGPDGDFTLSGGDPAQWFYNQHYPLLLDSQGSRLRLALFDNGDARPDNSGQQCIQNGTCYSRGVIMNVDESARTAEVSWEYALGWFSLWGGSVAVLPNGNVEMDSSTVNGGPSRVIEVTSGNAPQLVWQMDEQNPGTNYYRAYRIPSLYPGVWW